MEGGGFDGEGRSRCLHCSIHAICEGGGKCKKEVNDALEKDWQNEDRAK